MQSTPPESDAQLATPRAVVDRWAMVSARDIMRSDVITVPYSTPLSEVEGILADHRIGGAPVTDEAGRIVGIVSIRDIIGHYAEDPDSRPRRGAGFYELSCEEMFDEDYETSRVPAESEDTAEDVMSGQIYDVPADAGLRDIATVMAKHKIHRVLVQEESRHVGLISTLEILDALIA